MATLARSLRARPLVLWSRDAGGTPVFGIFASTLLTSLLVGANYSRSLVQLFTFSILLSTAATLLPYCVGAAAWLVRGGRKGRLVAAFGSRPEGNRIDVQPRRSRLDLERSSIPRRVRRC